jgi:hypothetical protein
LPSHSTALVLGFEQRDEFAAQVVGSPVIVRACKGVYDRTFVAPEKSTYSVGGLGYRRRRLLVSMRWRRRRYGGTGAAEPFPHMVFEATSDRADEALWWRGSASCAYPQNLRDQALGSPGVELPIAIRPPVFVTRIISRATLKGRGADTAPNMLTTRSKRLSSISLRFVASLSRTPHPL